MSRQHVHSRPPLPRIIHDVPVNGWLCIDKPGGMTSADVTNRLKRTVYPQKMGHAGTLDPLATGVLPIAIGEATKIIPYVMDTLKTYQCVIGFGSATRTDDSEGEVISTHPYRPGRKQLDEIIKQFEGKILQVPPLFSAIKVQGKRAYSMARNNEEVQLSPREINIESIRVIDFTGDRATLEVVCGKGTYIRSLARDIGIACGTVAHIQVLRRTKVGKFCISNAIPLEKYEILVHNRRLEEAILPIATGLDDIPVVEIESDIAAKIRHGQSISVEGIARGQVRVVSSGNTVAIGWCDPPLIKPVRVFNM